MTKVSRAILSLARSSGLVFVAFIVLASLGAPATARAEEATASAASKASTGSTDKSATKSSSKSTEKGAASATKGLGNSCGCYKDANGSCMCGRHAHCGCPGECEPRGCAEKHDRDIDREVKAEMKRAQDMDRKQTASRGKTSDDGTAAEPTPKTEARKAKPKRQGR